MVVALTTAGREADITLLLSDKECSDAAFIVSPVYPLQSHYYIIHTHIITAAPTAIYTWLLVE